MQVRKWVTFLNGTLQSAVKAIFVMWQFPAKKSAALKALLKKQGFFLGRREQKLKIFLVVNAFVACARIVYC